MKIIGNSRYQKSLNAALILNHLLEKGPISRIELAQTLGLKPSTVTYITARLLGAGLVLESPVSGSGKKSGRPPVLLELNRDYGRVIGIDLQADYYHGVITDAAGEVLERRRGSYGKPGLRFSELLGAVIEELRGGKPGRSGGDGPAPAGGSAAATGPGGDGSVRTSGPAKILGVGVALPGIIDSERSRIVECRAFKLRQEEYASFLEESYDFPVVMENDANCCARKMLWEFRSDRGDSANSQNLPAERGEAGWGESGRGSFIYMLPRFHDPEKIALDTSAVGVGLGLVVDGQVFRGTSFRAGEFHSAFADPGSPVEVSLSIEESRRLPGDSRLLRRFIGELLGNLVSMVSLLNPGAILIGGDLAGRGDMVGEILSGELKSTADYLERAGCRLLLPEDVSYDAATGAAAHLLTQLYHMPQADGRDIDSRKWSFMLANTVDVG